MREPVLPFPELPLSEFPIKDEPVVQPVWPPDEAERRMALDPRRSFLVQAPAGSGKTYLLTQRFLRLLAEAERPDEIVAITFTNAAAAEMRNRVLDALERAETAAVEDDPESLPGLARRAMERARVLGWQLLDQPNQLRITTIDAFCRGLALQSPLSWGVLSGLGGRLDTVDEPAELYRVAAAARTLGRLEGSDAALEASIRGAAAVAGQQLEGCGGADCRYAGAAQSLASGVCLCPRQGLGCVAGVAGGSVSARCAAAAGWSMPDAGSATGMLRSRAGAGEVGLRDGWEIFSFEAWRSGRSCRLLSRTRSTLSCWRMLFRRIATWRASC